MDKELLKELNLENELLKINQLRLVMPDEAELMEANLKKRLQEYADKKNAPSLHCEKCLNKFITADPEMLEVKSLIRKLASKDIDDTVLIIGESGTGKEILARALHGDRKEDAFVDINCAGLPEYLIESELFGHVKGAFTGADKDKKGLFKEAEGGTIFLDEIGDMPLVLQAKLLRVIQERCYRPVGSNTNFRFLGQRIIAATHHDLPKLVGEGKFRLDLYSRISTFCIVTKPIRARRGDIKLIIDHLEPTGACWKFLESGKHLDDAFDLNVRQIEKMVKQYKVLGKLI